MVRVTRSSAKASASTTKSKPYSRPASSKTDSSQIKPAKSGAKPRSGKDSHLYTDDNPSSTLKGTGFKDAATANHTIQLVSQRSLLYQFQTINTMYYRAKHHPSSETNSNFQAAMKIFRHWLDETYPAAREAQTDFPVLKKDVVQRFLPLIEKQQQEGELSSEQLEWAKMYAALPKGKRLANVLMDESRPDERDLAVVRQKGLEKLIEEDLHGSLPTKDYAGLWMKDGDNVSLLHLKMIAYGFSPVKPEILMKRIKDN